MRNYKKHWQHGVIAAAAGLTVSTAFAGTTAQPSGTSIPGNTNGNNYATISLSGSTALRNYTKSTGFTDLTNGATIFLSSGTFTANNADGTTSAELAPLKSDGTGDNSNGVQADVPALRVEWHEQGSVEGMLELVTDQLYGGNVANLPTGQAPNSLVSRAPTVSNPVWINRTTVIGDNTNTTAQTAGTNWAYGTTGTATGQSPVQMAIADIKPIQAFSVGGTASYLATPGTAGYGKGNPVGVAPSDSSGLGVVGSRQSLVDQTTLNIADPSKPSAPWTTAGVNNLTTTTVAITATTFTANPGTGLTNLNTNDARFLQLTGRLQNGATFQMATRDVNSGTRNSAANNTGIDPSWAIGLNDGGNTLVTTVATAADNQDIINDSPVTALDGTSIPQGTIRFSGKTSGGVLRVTVQNSRMAVGTLGLTDALGTNGAGDLNSAYTGTTPLRVLQYNGVSPTATTISNGTYAIWQQEQYVTIKNTNSAFSTNTASNYNASQWAATSDLQTGILGDTGNTSSVQTGNFSGGNLTLPSGSRGGYVQGQVLTGTGIAAGTTVTGVTYNSDGTIQSVQVSDTGATGTLTYTDKGGDVANLRSNVTNAIVIAGGTVGLSTTTNPGDALISNKYMLPQLMQVAKINDGATTTTNAAYNTNTNPNGFDAPFYNLFNGSSQARAESVPAPTITSPNSNATSSFGYYGQAVRGAGTGTGVVAANPVFMTNGSIAITPSNYLFGNFANNNVRDFQSFMYGVAAAKALYNSGDGVDTFDSSSATGVTVAGNASDATVLTDAQLNTNGVSLPAGSLASALGSASGFTGQRGPSGGNPQSFVSPLAFGTGVSKGDLIVMGDYNNDGRFDGKDIYAMAVGTALSENTSTNTLTSLADISTGVLRKNSALDFAQTSTADAAYTAVTNSNGTYNVSSNASGFLRQSARLILATTGSLPQGATALFTTGGTTSYTFDPMGTNAFNKTDVNQDGVVDFNDAVLVEQNIGNSYTTAAQALAATEPAPVSGVTKAANLVLIQQVDGEAAISSADVTVANCALTGTGTTNWYNGAVLNKTGSNTITWQRSGGAVNVNAGASFQISAGTVAVKSTIDPFTDNNTLAPANNSSTGSSVAITVANNATLKYTPTSTTGIQLDRLSNLNVSSSGLVTIDPLANHANHMVLEVGGLTLVTGSKIDLGNSDLIVKGGDLKKITTAVTAGYNAAGALWQGAGITSTSAANDSTHLTTLGVLNGSSGTFDKISVSPGDVLVKYTYYGDATLDGQVDGSDYSRIDNGFLSGASGWQNGDFNYDGSIDGSDYTLIDNAFNTQGVQLAADIANPTVQIADQIAGTSGSAAVPEPTALGLLGAGVGSLLSRRRRRA